MQRSPVFAAKLTVLLVTVAIAGSIGCGGHEDAAETPTPEPTPAAESTPGAETTQPAQGSEPALSDLSPEERENIRRLGEQRRADRRAQGLPDRRSVTQINPVEGSDTIELPESYPADIPLFPAASATRYAAVESDGTMTTLVTTEPVETALSYYTSALRDEGWSIDSEGSAAGLTMLNTSKDGRNLAVAFVEDNGETTITIIEIE